MPAAITGRILLVDDDHEHLMLCSTMFCEAGHTVATALDAAGAIDLCKRQPFDAVFCEVAIAGAGGQALFEIIRGHDADVPIILTARNPDLATAAKAVEYGAFRYLQKPATNPAWTTVAANAISLCASARVKHRMLDEARSETEKAADRLALTSTFDSALHQMWIAFQPIVRWSTKKVFAYEALVRSFEKTMSNPMAILDAAERLGQLQRLGRAIRAATTSPMVSNDCLLFVNLLPQDFEDDDLFSVDSPLAKMADRTVLEVTERASLDDVTNVRARIDQLRRMGFRIALDDVGAGYSGLNSFAVLEPDVVKLDMSLVRGVNESPTKQKLVRSMLALCEGLDTIVVAEGVETPEEWRALIDLGCDYFQGFLFARPALAFPSVSWGATLFNTTSKILRAGAS